MFACLIRKYTTIIVALALTVIMIVPFSQAVYADDTYAAAEALITSIGTRVAPRRPGAMGLRITGNVPDGRRVADAALRPVLTARFTAQAGAFAQNHQASALEINHSVEFFISTGGEYVSVVLTMEAVSATTTSGVATTVINVETNEIVALDGYNATVRGLVNNHIRNQIAANPRGFVSNFGGISADHPFYLDADRLVIPFGSAELIPTERAIHTVVFSLENFRNIVIGDDNFFQLPPEQYSTIMVRLTPVLRHFDYSWEWDSDTRTTHILSGDRIVSSLTVDENVFSYRRSATTKLEAAPKLFEGGKFVPLSFFDEVMGMNTIVNLSDGRITISGYMSEELASTDSFIQSNLQ